MQTTDILYSVKPTELQRLLRRSEEFTLKFFGEIVNLSGFQIPERTPFHRAFPVYVPPFVCSGHVVEQVLRILNINIESGPDVSCFSCTEPTRNASLVLFDSNDRPTQSTMGRSSDELSKMPLKLASLSQYLIAVGFIYWHTGGNHFGASALTRFPMNALKNAESAIAGWTGPNTFAISSDKTDIGASNTGSREIIVVPRR